MKKLGLVFAAIGGRLVARIASAFGSAAILFPRKSSLSETAIVLFAYMFTFCTSTAQATEYWAQYQFSISSNPSGPSSPAIIPIIFQDENLFDNYNDVTPVSLPIPTNIYPSLGVPNYLIEANDYIGTATISLPDQFERLTVNSSIINSFVVGSQPAPVQLLGPTAQSPAFTQPPGTVVVPPFTYNTTAWEQISVPNSCSAGAVPASRSLSTISASSAPSCSPSPMLQLQKPMTSSAQLSTQLVDVTTQTYNAPEVNAVAQDMGFSSFDFFQFMTEEINGQPFTTAACLYLYANQSPVYPCTQQARAGLSYDTKNFGGTLISIADATSFQQSDLIYHAGIGSGIFTDDPCQPGAVQLNFTDLLVGIDLNGNVKVIGPSPYIQGSTGFTWRYNGSNQWFRTGCPGSNSTVIESNPTGDGGVGTATFTGFIDTSNLPPDIEDALEAIDVLPPATAPEPSSVVLLASGILFLFMRSVRRRKYPSS